MAFTTVTDRSGPNSSIIAAHHNELAHYLGGSVRNLARLTANDPDNYAVIIKNEAPPSKALLVQDASGVTLLDISTAGTILGFADGSAGAPSIRFASDPDTGLFRAQDNSWSATVGGTERLRQFENGSVGLYGGGLFIRKDGIADQSATSMFQVANTTETAGNYGMASMSLYQTSPNGDNFVLRLVHRQSTGGGASRAVLRGIEIENIREVGTTDQTFSAGNVGIELGNHLAARSEAEQATATSEANYVAEASHTNPNLFLFSSGDAWIPGAKFWRSGAGLIMRGEDGFDYHLIIADVENNDLLVHDQYGRLRLRPAGFNGTGGIVYYYNGAYNDYTSNAAASAMSGGTTVPTPQSTTEYWYIGSRQTFGKIHVLLNTLQTYGAGSPVLLIQVWNGSNWAQVTPRTAGTFGAGDSGTVVSDGTSAFRQSGTIVFAPPGNWRKNDVNGNSRYWCRLSITGIVASGQGQADSILPGEGQVVKVWAAPGDTNGAFEVHHSGNTLIGSGSAYPSATRGGYLCIPTMTGGAPTGAPHQIGTRAALVYRTDTNVLYIFNPASATWRASAAFS